MASSDRRKGNLSHASVGREVRRRAAQGPLTVYPLVISALGGMYAGLISTNVWALAAILGGVGLAAANWIWQTVVRRGSNANAFVSEYQGQLAHRRRETINRLTEDLRDMELGAGEKQIELFQQKFANFEEVLDRKLDNTELTYNRYLTIAEQVFLGGLDSLEEAVLARRSVSAIDPNYIRTELTRLHLRDDPTAQARKEEFHTRLALRDAQAEKVRELLQRNEAALTELDTVTTRIASINTRQGHADVDLEAAMGELRRLAERAQAYSSKTPGEDSLVIEETSDDAAEETNETARAKRKKRRKGDRDEQHNLV